LTITNTVSQSIHVFEFDKSQLTSTMDQKNHFVLLIENYVWVCSKTKSRENQ